MAHFEHILKRHPQRPESGTRDIGSLVLAGAVIGLLLLVGLLLLGGLIDERTAADLAAPTAVELTFGEVPAAGR